MGAPESPHGRVSQGPFPAVVPALCLPTLCQRQDGTLSGFVLFCFVSDSVVPTWAALGKLGVLEGPGLHFLAHLMAAADSSDP